MFNKQNSPSNRGQKTIEKSLHGLATMLAFLAAIASAGPIFEYGYPPATEYFSDSWGYDFGELGGFTFCSACVVTVFFIARIGAVIGLMFLATRGLMYAF
ncbi:hypothetical protein QSV34_10780 [Porticoccus sp. W117]|uniref:hypothetical protein n=1 Tax=Porticoccus sp. W117 TaxID=3054777 RepID=UPI0025998C70|nr:hypothetical protein [Porticoccus sp. W117]MDM3871834.1 hypothetical protein [Porticoccus sp. W117]